MINPVDIAFALGAGLISVASPCVLPVLPIIVTGSAEDSKHRPLLITMGLSLSFIVMGIISSRFFHLLAGNNMLLLERISGGVIIAFGVMMTIGFNPFKSLGFLSNIKTNEKGYFSGFFLGLSLGIIWIPCVGLTLSSIFAKIASEEITCGILLLTIYSVGFSIPILLAGYSTQAFRHKIGIISRHPRIVSSVSGLLLIAFGAYIINSGLVNLGF